MRPVPDRAATGDRGSVLLLTLGLIATCLLAIVVVTDVSSAFLQRRSLSATADAAALAAAQVVDLEAYYATGATQELPLDRAGVRSAVLAHLRESHAFAAIPGLVVEAVSTDGRTVTVRLRAPLQVPFGGILEPGSAQVARAEASARLSFRAG